VEVQKIPEANDRKLPIVEEFDRIADQIRTQAYQLFAHRGGGGHELDDWLTAEREFCWPAAELAESESQYSLKVALAGFASKEIKVTVMPREIMIKATHKHQRSGADGEAELKWSEFRSNDIMRRFELPADVDVDRVSASLDNGLLEITAPKAEAAVEGSSSETELSAPS
jgi:HSP20 family protein